MTPLASARQIANFLVDLLEPGAKRRALEFFHARGETWLGGQSDELHEREYVTTNEAAQLAGTTPDRVRQWASRGRLERVGYSGREAVYRAEDVRRLAG